MKLFKPFLLMLVAGSVSGCLAIKEQPLPALFYDTPVAGANTERFIPTERLDFYDLVVDAYGDSPNPQWLPNVGEVLDRYAARVMAHPPGKRALWEWHLANSGYLNPRWNVIHHSEDGCKNAAGEFVMYTDFNGRRRPYSCPFFENGIKASRAKWTFLMQELKKRGVEFDYFSTENEVGFVNWGISPEGLRAIENDPRWPALATELGLPLDLTNTIGGLQNREMVTRFNHQISKRVYEAFHKGMWEPIFEAYPHLKTKSSDYAKFEVLPPWRSFDPNSWPMHLHTEPKSPYLFTQGSDLNYLSCGQLCQYEWLAPEIQPFPNTPWNTLILSLNQARAIVLSNPEDTFWPFIAPKTFTQNHPLYKEHILHLYLGGATGLVFWNPQEYTGVEDWRILTEALEEADPMAGFSDRKTLINAQIDWHAEEIETCALANEKHVCRLTKKDGTGTWVFKEKK